MEGKRFLEGRKGVLVLGAGRMEDTERDLKERREGSE